jgi:hypothetical protein
MERVPLAEIEVVCVDYGTPMTQKSLHEVLVIPKQLQRHVRFIIVPRLFHLTFGASVPFLEYIAKNIGIYRSHGEFVVAMNPDSLLSDNFFELCAQRAFNPGVFYTSYRKMMSADHEESVELMKINETWHYPSKHHFSTFRLLTPDKEKFGYDYVPGLGDFTMLSKELWDALGGHHMFPSNTYVDHLFKAKMLKLISGGYAIQLPNPVLHQYHPHVSSSRPSESLAFVNSTLNDYFFIRTTHPTAWLRGSTPLGLSSQNIQRSYIVNM